MAAPQQSQLPTYKETSNIPRARTYDNAYRVGNTPGAALADMLGALPSAMTNIDANREAAETKPGVHEKEQLAALGVMGADRNRLNIAKKGGSFFGLIGGEEADMDDLDEERGRIAGQLYGGQIMTAYAKAGLNASSDPSAYSAFMKQQQDQIFGTALKDVSPSYYHGFLLAVAPTFEGSAKAFAGDLDSFLQHENKIALETDLKVKSMFTQIPNTNQSYWRNMTDALMVGESKGNYNAYFGNSNNTEVKLTEMTLAQARQFNRDLVEKQGNGALGKYQFVIGTFDEVVRDMGLDPETTLFNEETQDKMAFYRFMTTRKGADWLAGKMSTREFVDKYLVNEWAALKSSSGAGAYDHDGVNKATMGANDTIAILDAFKAQMGPAYAEKATNESGGVNLDLVSAGLSSNPVVNTIVGAPKTYGQPEVQAAQTWVEGAVAQLENDPASFNTAMAQEAIQELEKAGLPPETFAPVKTAMENTAKLNDLKQQVATREAEVETQKSAVEAVLNPGSDAFNAIAKSNPAVAQAIMQRQVTPQFHPVDNAGFLRDFNPGSLDAYSEAFAGYAQGAIDKQGLAMAKAAILRTAATAPILNDPIVLDTFETLKTPLRPDIRKAFDGLIEAEIEEHIQTNGRPPSRLQAVQLGQTIQQTLMQQQVEQITAQQGLYSLPQNGNT